MESRFANDMPTATEAPDALQPIEWLLEDAVTPDSTDLVPDFIDTLFETPPDLLSSAHPVLSVSPRLRL